MVYPVVMYGCESWTIKKAECWNWCFWTVVLEKTLESPLECKEIQPVHPKVDHSWVFTGRTDAKAKTPILWPPHAKSWLIGKNPDTGMGLGAGRKGDYRGWDGWMASPTPCTWVWVNSRSWWWTGRPGVLRFMESHSRTRLSNWTELILYWCFSFWLTSLCILGSSFIHLIRTDSNVFFFIAE